MSPRNHRLRKILNRPAVKGFKPYGPDVNTTAETSVNMLFEEYEALRLCDYDILNHHQASEIMNVSRPTFTRIYASARKKLAKAFVEGLQISIEGGKVYFDSEWYYCNSCKCHFNNPDSYGKIQSCALCNNADIEICGSENVEDDNCAEYCSCKHCGYKGIQHSDSGHDCPECGAEMKRKGRPKCGRKTNK